ncbi:MAG: cation:proton antiporter [Candidatus Hadarchaeales archaeon]
MLLYLSLCLLAAKVGGAVALRLRQPTVFGELLMGILLGPSVAGWIAKEVWGNSWCLDPQSQEGMLIHSLAEVGILTLMFLAGLSIDLDEFRKVERPAITVATLGVIVAFFFGFTLAFVYGWSWKEAAFAGGILVATSVGITVRSLLDLHRLSTRAGMVIVGAAVIDDIFGIIILSLLVGLVYGGISILGFFESLALIVAFFILVLVGGMRVGPKILDRVSHWRVEEATLSVGMALAFLIAALAETVNVAAITGAFLMGLVLSRSTAVGSLKEKVSVVGYGFLIPLFFVDTGIRTDLGALRGLGFLALLFLVISVVSKIMGCGLGGLLGGLGMKDSLRVGVGMIPRAEVALIIAAIGRRAGVVGGSLFSLTVLMVLFTTLLTPPLLKWVFSEQGGKGHLKKSSD